MLILLWFHSQFAMFYIFFAYHILFISQCYFAELYDLLSDLFLETDKHISFDLLCLYFMYQLLASIRILGRDSNCEIDFISSYL